MAAKNICEFPRCGNTQERAAEEGKPFKLNRIPISRPLSDKWDLVFRCRLDDRIGQFLFICGNHYDETNRRLILPQPIKKTTARKYDIVRPPPPVRVRDVMLQRKAAKEGIAKIHESLKEVEESVPGPPIKREKESDDESAKEEVPFKRPKFSSTSTQQVAKKKTGRPRKSSDPDPEWMMEDESVPLKPAASRLSAPSTTAPTTVTPAAAKPKQEKKSWWGDDSDSDDGDHFGGNDDGGGGFDDRASSPELAQDKPSINEVSMNTSFNALDDSFIGSNESFSELESTVRVKTERRFTTNKLEDAVVRLERVDDLYEQLFQRPIEEACQEVLVYELELEKEKQTFQKQQEELQDKYRRFSQMLHKSKWRNEQLVKEIKIKTNKMAFLRKVFGENGIPMKDNEETVSKEVLVEETVEP